MLRAVQPTIVAGFLAAHGSIVQKPDPFEDKSGQPR
jgi:hypothetical protein